MAFRFGRRWLVRSASLVTGMASLGFDRVTLAAGPDRAVTTDLVTWAPFCDCWGIPQNVGQAIVEKAMAPFFAANPSIRVQYAAPSGDSWVPQALLAGTAPDIFVNSNTTASMSLYFDTNALADLSRYVRRDNVDLTVFPRPAMQVVEFGQQILGLPSYVGVAAMIVNQGALDELGLEYPQDGWTYEQWSNLWRAVGIPKKRFAVNLYISGFSGPWFPSTFLYEGWGGQFIDPVTEAKTDLDSSPDVAAAEWWFPWVQDGLATVGIWPNAQQFNAGNLITAESWMGGGVLQSVILPALSAGVKFDFNLMPSWPVRPATIMDGNYWMMSASAKYPDAAWELLRYIATQPAWPQSMMHATMLPPALKSLTEPYLAMVKAVVPPLRQKNLTPLIAPILNDSAYPNRVFKYENTQAYTVYGQYAQNVVARKQSVTVAYRLAAKQINALEATGPIIAGQRAALQKSAQSEIAKAAASATVYTYPAPARSVSWAGEPPAQAATAVKVSMGGSVTVSGQGGNGIWGTDDGGTFAGSAFQLSRGSFTCRLVSIALPAGGTVAYAGGAGLMARGNLSSSGPFAAVVYLPDQGVFVDARAFDGLGAGWTQGAASMPGGAPAASWQSARKAGANWLSQPLWLRLELGVNSWLASTSLDGQRWTAVAGAQSVLMAGAWVGLFVTSNASGQVLQASFDHLTGFRPDVQVRIGSA